MVWEIRLKRGLCKSAAQCFDVLDVSNVCVVIHIVDVVQPTHP